MTVTDIFIWRKDYQVQSAADHDHLQQNIFIFPCFRLWKSMVQIEEKIEDNVYFEGPQLWTGSFSIYIPSLKGKSTTLVPRLSYRYFIIFKRCFLVFSFLCLLSTHLGFNSYSIHIFTACHTPNFLVCIGLKVTICLAHGLEKRIGLHQFHTLLPWDITTVQYILNRSQIQCPWLLNACENLYCMCMPRI